jgi:acetyl-CoA acetyltransferase family protein
LQAVHFAAQGVMAGVYDMAIAGGVEVMSRVPMGATLKQGPGIPKTQSLRDRYQLDRPWFDQAVGAELIAHQWNLSREELDAFSLTSHRRATQARETGKFDQEIVPVTIPGLDECILEQDECIRTDTTLEKMAALKPAYSGLELLTAGNSSQICDAASAVLIMTPELAHALGIRPRARFVSFSVVGVDPVTMLTGPILATQKILTRSGLTVDDIGLFEVNEAFASVVLAWQREIHAPWNKINVNGGAIALGHPLGATGTRIIATLLNALEDRGQRYGLATICEGGGLANATLIERL